MKVLQSGSLRKGTSGPIRWILRVVLVLAAFSVIVAGGLYLRLLYGPLDVGRSPEHIAARLAHSLRPGWSLSFDSVALTLYQHAPGLRINKLIVRNAQGVPVIRAGNATMAVSFLPLLRGGIEPRTLDLDDVRLRVLIHKDGSLAMAPPEADFKPEDVSVPAPAGASPLADVGGGSAVSRQLRRLFGEVFDDAGLLSHLQYARVSNSDLTVESVDRHLTRQFNNLTASVTRTTNDHRSFQASGSGEQGEWRLFGSVVRSGETAFRSDIHVEQASIRDIILLAGLSSLPLTTDISVSGELHAAVDNDVVERLEGTLTAHSGEILLNDKDASPVIVDEISVNAAWSELERAVLLNKVLFKGGKNQAALKGMVLFDLPDAAARLQLTGNMLRLSGLTDAEPVVRIDEISAAV
ncbi:MAG: hypothetical protein LBR29_07440, partial [Methylobacteriaceae bacterium]|nr:hypothetical protein [Methylobacteriaceae bacterium]